MDENNSSCENRSRCKEMYLNMLMEELDNTLLSEREKENVKDMIIQVIKEDEQKT